MARLTVGSPQLDLAMLHWLAVSAPTWVLATGLLAPGLSLGPREDAAVWQLVGEEFLQGRLPYRDVWDHKPPGIYAINAAAALLPGSTWPWIWTFTLAALLGTWAILSRLTSALPALLAVAAIAGYPAALGGGMTETFALVPAAGAVLSSQRGHALGGGLLAGLACLTSPQLLPVLAAVLVMSPRPWRAVAAATSVGLAAALVLAAAGVLVDAFDAVIRYSGAYLRSERASDLWRVPAVLLMLMPLIALAAGRRTPITRGDAAALVWLAAGTLLVAVQARFYFHYLAPLAVPLAILARGPHRWPLLAVAVVAFGIQLVALQAVPPSAPRFDVVEAIQEMSAPTDRILVWGFAPELYVAAQRRPAGRYIYSSPVTTQGYSSLEQVRRWVAELEADPPEVVVDAGTLPRAPDGTPLDGMLAPLASFIDRHYCLRQEVAGVDMYELRTASPTGRADAAPCLVTPAP